MTTMAENTSVDQWFLDVKPGDELHVTIDKGPKLNPMMRKEVNALFLWDWLDNNRDLYFTTIVSLSTNVSALIVVFHHPPVGDAYGLKIYKNK